MKFNHYSERVQSPAWARFTRACKSRAACRCQMCGDVARPLQVHHMRYHRLGTAHEWFDVVVLCDWCHSSYHEQRRLPPNDYASRYGLLVELAKVLMRAGRDTTFFLDHGEKENGLWCGSIHVEDGLLESPSRGNTSWKKPRKTAAQKKEEQRKRVALYWNTKRYDR